MLFTKEYLNILKMDFNSVLKKSKNKKKTLNNIINQLQIRYTNANTNSINLNKQKSILLREYEKITTKTETLKKTLATDFTKSEPNNVFKHIDNYYKLKYKQLILKTNIIFL
jgi:phage shock protein A